MFRTSHQESKSSAGKPRSKAAEDSSPTSHLDELLTRADEKAHAVLDGPDGKPAFVVLTAEHFKVLREALTECYTVAVALDPDAEFVSTEEMRLRTAGADLAKARKAKGWTQAQLATKTGVPQSQISRIERKPDNTTVRTMRKLAKALGVDVRQLIKP